MISFYIILDVTIMTVLAQRKHQNLICVLVDTFLLHVPFNFVTAVPIVYAFIG